MRCRLPRRAAPARRTARRSAPARCRAAGAAWRRASCARAGRTPATTVRRPVHRARRPRPPRADRRRGRPALRAPRPPQPQRAPDVVAPPEREALQRALYLAADYSRAHRRGVELDGRRCAPGSAARVISLVPVSRSSRSAQAASMSPLTLAASGVVRASAEPQPTPVGYLIELNRFSSRRPRAGTPSTGGDAEDRGRHRGLLDEHTAVPLTNDCMPAHDVDRRLVLGVI